MNKRSPKNVSASVHQRLLNVAKDTQRPFNEVASVFRYGALSLSTQPNRICRLIKEDADYEGVRIRFRGQLGKARIHMQVDVGFGDIVHPNTVLADYPALLDLAAPSLRIYPPETVLSLSVKPLSLSLTI